MARRQGSYMKPTIFALVFTFVLASNLHAQASRNPVWAPGAVNGWTTSLDVTDPARVMFARPESNAATPSPHASYAVPVSQLRIPSKALKEFERSQTAFQSGDLRASAEHLQKALQIYPDFIQAHNSLGLRFVQLGEYQKALAEHEIALSLDPRSVQTHQDLALALLLLNRAKEGEAEARQALDLDSQSVSARYLLARALIAQRQVTPEAIEMLRQSENVYPNASLVLAQIHFTAGRTDQVIAELRHYLRAPVDLDNKQKAECWVAQLSQQPSPAGCPAETTRPAFH
jgi:tetratricopeptide (TPR) repeat protein